MVGAVLLSHKDVHVLPRRAYRLHDGIGKRFLQSPDLLARPSPPYVNLDYWHLVGWFLRRIKVWGAPELPSQTAVQPPSTETVVQ